MKRIIAWTALLLLLLSPGALAEQNLLINGDFSSVAEDGCPVGWRRMLWKGSTAAEADVTENGEHGNDAMLYGGENCYIRWRQKVAVEPNTVYRLSVFVSAELENADKTGAGFVIEESREDFPFVLKTDGKYQPLEAYGKTGSEQTSLTFALRIGAEDSLNRGTALFRNAALVKAGAVPSGAPVLDLSGASRIADVSPADSTTEETMPARYTPALLFAAIAALLFGLFIYTKRDGLPENGRYYKKAFAAVLVLGFVARVLLAFLARGLDAATQALMLWSESAANGDFALFTLLDDRFAPGYVLLLAPIAFLKDILGAETGSAAHAALLKLLPALGDLALAWVIYAFARKRRGERCAFLLGTGFVFAPAVLLCSGALAETDCLFALMLALCVLCVADRHFSIALPAFTAGMLLSGDYAYLLPAGAALLIYPLLNADKDKKMAREGLFGLAWSAALLYAVGLFFTYPQSPSLFAPFQWVFNRYARLLYLEPFFGNDALNIYELLDMNLEPTAAFPLLTVAGWVLTAGAWLFVLLRANRGKASNPFLLCGTLLTLLACVSPMMGPRALYPAAALLLFAYAQTPDARILLSSAVSALILFMNGALVLQGGTEVFAHLQESERWLNVSLSVLNLLNAGFLCVVFARGPLARHKDETVKKDAPMRREEKTDYHLRLSLRDYAIMGAVSVLYAALAFTNLGDMTGPQTVWYASAEGEQVVFDLGQKTDYYFTYNVGCCNTRFTVELSDDGENWTEPYYAMAKNGDVYHWRYFVPYSKNDKLLTLESGEHLYHGVRFSSSEAYYPYQSSRYLRLTAEKASLALNEVGFLDLDKNILPVSAASALKAEPGKANDPRLLIDEQDVVPAVPTYMNSAYFDEVYHARTAYEYMHSLKPYEWTHPPLGRDIMMIGIKLFGMTPFGWRFMGTLIGVLMLPAMYLLMMQLTHKRKLSAFSMALLALDNMHFVQTRIATVDSYVVLFIMLMVTCMVRYMQMDWKREGLSRTLVPLALSGLFMGLACASKWIGVYGGVGLAVLFFWTIGARTSEFLKDRACDPRYGKNLLTTLLCCVGFFIVVPLLIYYFSYDWHMQYSGGLTLSSVAQLQGKMLDYHGGSRGSTHFYCSPWYQWPVIGWPMSFYSGGKFIAADTVSRITCMGNPVIWWAGLAAVAFGILFVCVKRRADKNWLTVLIAYLAQLCPWLLVTRGTFIYHYFSCVPFLIAALTLCLNGLTEKRKKLGTIAAYVTLGLAAAAFALYFPLLCGLPVSKAYASALSLFAWRAF